MKKTFQEMVKLAEDASAGATGAGQIATSTRPKTPTLKGKKRQPRLFGNPKPVMIRR